MPLINGKNYDWGNITVVALGVPFTGITDISFDEGQDSTNNYGAGYEPTGYGTKNKVYDNGSMSLYFDEVVQMAALAPDGDIMKIPPFTVSVIFQGPGVPYRVKKILNCRFVKNPFSSKQNDSNIVLKIPFAFAGVK